jgi:rubrerythrin
MPYDLDQYDLDHFGILAQVRQWFCGESVNMLSTKVTTAQELMSIALRAERETTRRYERLAADMREAGNLSAAALFERMVIEEREHECKLLEWMARESLEEQTDIGPIRWRDPLVSTTYDDEARDPRYSTPYKALAFAVNNEENAFRFYTHVAAEADNEAVRGYAEALAHEELEHAELFRAERRRAYHAERDCSEVYPLPDPGAIHSEAELLAITICLDRHFANAIGQIGIDSPRLAGLADEAQQQISKNKALLDSLPPTTPQVVDEIVSSILRQSDYDDAAIRDGFATVTSELQQLKILCDRSFTFYDAIVDSTTDEAIMHEAQAQASISLDRTGGLQQVILSQDSPLEG